MTETTPQRVDELARSSEHAAREMRRSSATQRVHWLTAVADALDRHARELIDVARSETHLGEDRLVGEVARTTGQLRFFREVVADGSYIEAIVDPADPGTVPARPDLRRMLVPVGPVAVYAASNFPFAFSVAGGDTASALAVGCPVVVKAHSGHPELSRRTAVIVGGALAEAGAPIGAFALVEGRAAGVALIEHPAIRAAGFTGSVPGGRALLERATARPDPIPFYGELGSINPVIVTPSADRVRGAELARGFAASFQLGSGQFCTKPGVVFVPRGSVLEAALPDHVATGTHELLTSGITASFVDGVEHLLATRGVEAVGGASTRHGEAPRGVVAAVDIEDLRDQADELLVELFGPAAVLVRYDRLEDIAPVLAGLEGSLTATLHAEADEDISELQALAEERAGRILFSGWPTGVAVTWAQHHGGPWPSTTSIFTSVGATAVRRFLRPIAYQDAPSTRLPLELRDDNPLGIPRRVNGVLEPAR